MILKMGEYTLKCMSHYRRGLEWWPDLLDPLMESVITLYSALQHTLVSTVTSSVSVAQ
jgi:hypothetical protein